MLPVHEKHFHFTAGSCGDKGTRGGDYRIDRQIVRRSRHMIYDLQIEGSGDSAGVRAKRWQQPIVVATTVAKTPTRDVEGDAGHQSPVDPCGFDDLAMSTGFQDGAIACGDIQA